jgi:hypothetical protein
MDFLFKKRLLMRNKPTMGMFKKSAPMGLQIAPSMMRRPLIGAGGAGIRRPAVITAEQPFVGVGGAGIRRPVAPAVNTTERPFVGVGGAGIRKMYY